MSISHCVIKKNTRYARSSVHSKLPNSIFELHEYLCMYEMKINKQDIFY